jgi:hypothetical protein
MAFSLTEAGGAKGRGFGLNACSVAANEVSPEPRRDREIRAGHEQLLGRSFGLLSLAGFLTTISVKPNPELRA